MNANKNLKPGYYADHASAEIISALDCFDAAVTYSVTVEDAAENCDTVYHEEIFDNYDAAYTRFEELADEVLSGLWGDHRRCLLAELRDGDYFDSMDEALS